MAQPPPPPPGPDDETYVETTETEPYPPGRRVVVDEAPPRGDVWPWVLAGLLGALAILFLVLWLTHRDKGATTRRVPDLVGLKRQQAEEAAAARNFRVKPIARVASTAPGTVLDQAPNAGARLEKNSLIAIVVSSGRSQAKMPQLAGLKLTAAKRLADSLHLNVRTQEVASDKAAGVVVSQQPAAGVQTAQGSDVVLLVSNGSNRVAVPALRGLSLEKATAALAKAGLSARVISVAAPEAAGTVIAQDPASGQQIARGSPVRVNVSTGPTGSNGSTTLTSISTSVSVATTTVISTATVTTTVTTTEPAP